MLQQITLLREAEPTPEPTGQRRYPALQLAADNRGRLIVRCSIVSGEPQETVHEARGLRVSANFEATTTFELSSEQTRRQFEGNLAEVLFDIKREAKEELAGRRKVLMVAANGGESASVSEPENTHIHISVFTRAPAKEAWRPAVHEVSAATQISHSIPVTLDSAVADKQIDAFLVSVYRAAMQRQGYSL